MLAARIVPTAILLALAARSSDAQLTFTRPVTLDAGALDDLGQTACERPHGVRRDAVSAVEWNPGSGKISAEVVCASHGDVSGFPARFQASCIRSAGSWDCQSIPPRELIVYGGAYVVISSAGQSLLSDASGPHLIPLLVIDTPTIIRLFDYLSHLDDPRLTDFQTRERSPPPAMSCTVTYAAAGGAKVSDTLNVQCDLALIAVTRTCTADACTFRLEGVSRVTV